MSVNSESIRCMLLPLSSINLLIPNSAVAEVIGYFTPTALTDSSRWFPGVVMWRGVHVPVISIEEMCSIDAPIVGARSRIAIIYNPEKDAELPYLGIHIQDIPRAYLAEPDKMESGSDDGLSQYLLSNVDDDHLARFIPNLDNIIADLKVEYTQEKIDQLSI
ncbi:MAG: chemotaxis protein CheW [Proteobacteria bacterium]|nr:chemotaxis protein CheW [Pseudomonadota bacterium]